MVSIHVLGDKLRIAAANKTIGCWAEILGWRFIEFLTDAYTLLLEDYGLLTLAARESKSMCYVL